MILWPGDAHMPGVATAQGGSARKVVVKIKIDD
jgi:beta-galactosidase beta subunit